MPSCSTSTMGRLFNIWDFVSPFRETEATIVVVVVGATERCGDAGHCQTLVPLYSERKGMALLIAHSGKIHTHSLCFHKHREQNELRYGTYRPRSTGLIGIKSCTVVNTL